MGTRRDKERNLLKTTTMDIPKHLSHNPIVAVDYSSKDSTAGDAKYLSIGQATWADNRKDFSAKVFRKNEGKDDERWSRQSEELPLWRVLDLAILLVSQINNVPSYLKEEVVSDREELHEDLRAFLAENAIEYTPRLNELRRILCLNNNQNTPNIFSYATSELSQDAILAWIISWADPSMRNYDESLNDVAISLLKTLINEPLYDIKKVEIRKQWHNIDIGVLINDDMFLIIEDKTNTSIHDNQLERYRESANKEFGGTRRILGAYVKTGNESLKTIRIIKETGYNVIERYQVLECLSMYSGHSDLLRYFKEHLLEIEKKTNSFLTLPPRKWCWEAWEGFYRKLEEYIKVTDWGYVSNPSGGFLGLNWHWIRVEDDVNLYLQIEEPDKLCIKIEYLGNKDRRSEIRDKYHNILLTKANILNHNEIKCPKRFGHGTYMTIGVVDLVDIIGSEKLQLDNTIVKLKSYEHLLKCCRSGDYK